MSHEIYQSSGIAKAAYTTGRPAWHGLGQEFPAGTLPSKAFEAAHINGIELATEILYLKRNDTYIPVEKQGHLVRLPWGEDTEPFDLGVVSNDYEIVQPRVIGEMLDKLGKYADIDACGALGKGERIFATLRGDLFKVLCNGKQDGMEMYLLLYIDQRPGNAIQFIFSPVRTVCQNTVRAAQSAALLDVKLTHNKGANDMTKWAIDVLAKIASKEIALQQSLNAIAGTVVTMDQVVEVVEAAWPLAEMPSKVKLGEYYFGDQIVDPNKLAGQELIRWNTYHKALVDWKQGNERVEKLRNQALEVYVGHPTQQEIAGTAWGAYNAVTFVTDHVGQGRGTGVRTAMASTFGERTQAKIRAWEKCVSFIDASEVQAIQVSSN